MAISSSNIRHVFLTGLPGVGKTTLIRQIVEQLQSKSISAQGFYTAEVPSGGSGKRCGFDVVTLSGKTGQLSRVGAAGRGPSVGQYIVDLPSFESVALPELTLKDDSKVAGVVLIIDEIGKMELFSQTFIQLVRRLLGQSHCSIVGTIPVSKGKPLGFVEEIRSRKDVKIFLVTKENRNSLLTEIMETVMQARTPMT